MNFTDKLMIFGSKIIKKYTNFMPGEKINKVIKSEKKLIIIFGHPKCKPCQKIMFSLPLIMFKLKRKNITLKFYNVLENKEQAKNFNIKITPTLIYFENGEIKEKIENEKEIFGFLK